MKRTMSLIMCALLTVMLLAGCGEDAPEAETIAQETLAQETVPQQTLSTPTEPAAEEETAGPQEPQSGVLENNTEPEACFDIETPYGMLKYPMEWVEHVEITQEENQDVLVISFYGVLEGKENHRLFDVVFGGEEGDCVGQIHTDTALVPVYFRTYSVYENKTLTEDESEMLLAMMEDINEVFSSLQAMENFQ